MRDPKSVPGGAGSEARDVGPQKTRSLDVRFASGADATVGRRLKEMYDGLVSEPVPDRFLDLLSQLENAEKPVAASGTAGKADAAVQSSSVEEEGRTDPGAKP